MTKVIDAKANDNYMLVLSFSDGTSRRFDVKPYLELGIFSELKDPEYFSQVSIAHGTVNWPNEQDFAPETLYIESELIN